MSCIGLRHLWSTFPCSLLPHNPRPQSMVTGVSLKQHSEREKWERNVVQVFLVQQVCVAPSARRHRKMNYTTQLTCVAHFFTALSLFHLVSVSCERERGEKSARKKEHKWCRQQASGIRHRTSIRYEAVSKSNPLRTRTRLSWDRLKTEAHVTGYIT